MPDLDNVTPAGGNAAPTSQQTTDDPVIENADTQGSNPETRDGPPPSNADRAAAKAEKEAAEKAAKEQADADAEAAAENADGDEGEGEEDEDEGKELDTAVWGDAGDDVANSVLQTLQNSGVTTDEAKALLWDAVEAGDPTKVDRDALVEKVGKAKATLIMAGIENVTSRNNERVAEVSKIAHDAAGGRDNWSKATKWAVAKLPAGELDELRNMLDKGGRQAKFAAAEIVERYNADPKNTALTAGKAQVKPDGKVTSAVKGITRREYGEQLDKLHRRGASQAEFNALRAQRAAGKKQGI